MKFSPTNGLYLVSLLHSAQTLQQCPKSRFPATETAEPLPFSPVFNYGSDKYYMDPRCLFCFMAAEHKPKAPAIIALQSYKSPICLSIWKPLYSCP